VAYYFQTTINSHPTNLPPTPNLDLKMTKKTIFITIFVGKCFDSTSTLFYDFRCNYFIRDFFKCCSLTPFISDPKNAIRMSDFFSLKYLTISLTFDWRISDFRVQIIGKMQYAWEIRVQSFISLIVKIHFFVKFGGT